MLRRSLVGVQRPCRKGGLLVALSLVGVVLAGAVSVRADDEAWKQRIERALAVVETGVAVLDEKAAPVGTLAERIRALHARLLPLEKEAEIQPGSVSGTDDLSAATLDATNLNSRWKAVVKARSAPRPPPKKPGDDGKSPPPPPPPPPPEPADPADSPTPPKTLPPSSTPPKPVGKPWPTQIAFKATAKMTYVQTGHWVRVETEPYVYVNRFWMDGFSGKVSFSVRAVGLLKDVKSVVVRVAVRMKGPVTEVSPEYRLSDVTWTAEKVLGNDSLRSWVNYDEYQLAAPPRWFDGGPRGATIPLDAEAYVVSLVLPDGTAMTFETPEYNKPKR